MQQSTHNFEQNKRASPVQATHAIAMKHVLHNNSGALAPTTGLLSRFDALNRCNDEGYLKSQVTHRTPHDTIYDHVLHATMEKSVTEMKR